MTRIRRWWLGHLYLARHKARWCSPASIQSLSSLLHRDYNRRWRTVIGRTPITIYVRAFRGFERQSYSLSPACWVPRRMYVCILAREPGQSYSAWVTHQSEQPPAFQDSTYSFDSWVMACPWVGPWHLVGPLVWGTACLSRCSHRNYIGPRAAPSAHGE